MSRLEPLLGELDRLFSRKVLGSIFTAGALGEIAQEAVTYYTGGEPPMEMAVWSVLLGVTVVAFAWWERVEAAKQRAAESASETHDSVSERVEESIEGTKASLTEAKESAGETKESLSETKESLGEAKEALDGMTDEE